MSDDAALAAIIANVQRLHRTYRREWTAEEDAFYLEHLGIMSLEEIGEALGRSATAVKVHRYRVQLPSHRRAPGFLTAHQASVLLGLDSHVVPQWIDKGMMPGQGMPSMGGRTRRISWVGLKMWLCKPESWIYLHVERIKHESLRSLVMRAQERWGDEWWDTNRVAAYHNCDNKDIQRYIKAGKLPAVHAVHIGARGKGGWARWFVRKSDAVQLRVCRGYGSGQPEAWPPRADAFILRARAEGMTCELIARMMKWPLKRVMYRARMLARMNEGGEPQRRRGRKGVKKG